MISIQSHPIWKNISVIKKPLHLLRIRLARSYARLYPKSMFIGITGSVGKTTTVRFCSEVLSQKFRTVSTTENLDSILNIPITLLKLNPKVQKVILEMGIEYKGEMEFYLSIIKPQTAIITRIYFAHSEYLGGVEEIIKEKSALVVSLPKNGTAILNWDDLYCRKIAENTKANVIFYGSSSKNCHIWASNVRIENYKTCFELNYGVERVEIRLNLLGRHFVSCALAAAALGVSNDLSLMSIKTGLEKIETAPHRLHLEEGINGAFILDDTYNSSPIAVEEALNVILELPARRRIIVLGEMRELGEYSEKLHRQIAQKIFKEKMDLVLLTGGDAKFIGDELIKLGFPSDRVELNLSNSQIVAEILQTSKKGDMVLVKGSHSLRLDEVVERITKK